MKKWISRQITSIWGYFFILNILLYGATSTDTRFAWRYLFVCFISQCMLKLYDFYHWIDYDMLIWFHIIANLLFDLDLCRRFFHHQRVMPCYVSYTFWIYTIWFLYHSQVGAFLSSFMTVLQNAIGSVLVLRKETDHQQNIVKCINSFYHLPSHVQTLPSSIKHNVRHQEWTQALEWFQSSPIYEKHLLYVIKSYLPENTVILSKYHEWSTIIRQAHQLKSIYDDKSFFRNHVFGFNLIYWKQYPLILLLWLVFRKNQDLNYLSASTYTQLWQDIAHIIVLKFNDSMDMMIDISFDIFRSDFKQNESIININEWKEKIWNFFKIRTAVELRMMSILTQDKINDVIRQK